MNPFRFLFTELFKIHVWPKYLHTEASVRMLVYVVNILMMFAGPASWGDVTEAGLADAAILHTVKEKGHVCSHTFSGDLI